MTAGYSTNSGTGTSEELVASPIYISAVVAKPVTMPTVAGGEMDAPSAMNLPPLPNFYWQK